MTKEKKKSEKKIPKKVKPKGVAGKKNLAEFRDACSEYTKEKEAVYVKQLADPVHMGRPTTYTEELALRIYELISTTTVSIQRLTQLHDWMPARSTMILWEREHDYFSILWNRAKENRAHLYVEESVDISDDGSNDYIECIGKDGEPYTKLNSEHIQRSKLRIDTRKWVASKYNSSNYGDRQQEAAQSSERIKDELIGILTKLVQDNKKDY